MKLTFLGTGNAFVTECYNTCFAIAGDKGTLLVDAGGGNGILRALRKADINYKDITDIFVTHKHIDHLLGVMWLIRLYCQRMREGVFTGEVTLYSHDEVIKILTAMVDMLLQEKEKPFFGTRFRLVTVADGEEKEIIGNKFTFFDIGSTKAKQFGFSADLCEKNSSAVATNRFPPVAKPMRRTPTGSLPKRSVFTAKRISSSLTKNTIPR